MRPEKLSIVSEIRGHLDGSTYVCLVDFRGLKVEQVNALRQQLRRVGARSMVVKNSLLGKIAAERGGGDLGTLLRGPTAMITGGGDVTEVAKALKAFIVQHQKPAIKGGLLAGRLMSAEDVEALAMIPSREVLLGRVVGTIAAPMTQMAGVLNQKVLSLLYALKAVAEKKGEGTKQAA